MKKKLMCGPAAGTATWKKLIKRDIAIANLEKARKVKQERKEENAKHS